MKREELFDVCRNRHRGNAESEGANPPKDVKRRDREKVYEIVKSSRGVTSKEIAEQMNRRLNCISGRISELKRSELVVVRGRRSGCGVIYAS